MSLIFLAVICGFLRLGYATTTLLDGIVTSEQLQAARVAAIELSGCVMEYFEKASAKTEQGLIADLAARYASGELEQIPALGMMLTLFSAAGESTASLLGSAAWILADRPESNGGFVRTLNCWEFHRRGIALRVAVSWPLPICMARHHVGRRRGARQFSSFADVGSSQPRSGPLRGIQ